MKLLPIPVLSILLLSSTLYANEFKAPALYLGDFKWRKDTLIYQAEIKISKVDKHSDGKLYFEGTGVFTAKLKTSSYVRGVIDPSSLEIEIWGSEDNFKEGMPQESHKGTISKNFKVIDTVWKNAGGNTGYMTLLRK